MKEQREAERVDAAIRGIFTVSHDEMKRRELEWKKHKAAKRQAKKAGGKIQ
jgi:hypothetical protein